MSRGIFSALLASRKLFLRLIDQAFDTAMGSMTSHIYHILSWVSICSSQVKESTWVEVKVNKRNYTNETTIEKVELLDPHTVMDYLFTHVGLRIDMASVKEFWRRKRAAGEPWAVCSKAGEDSIPLALYGDECRLYANSSEKMFGLFVSLPLWRPRSTRFSRWCIFAIEDKKMLSGGETLVPVLQRLVYSINMLFRGNPNIACGHKFCVTEIRGDWQFHRILFMFSSSWHWRKVKDICFRCNCMAKSANEKRLYYYSKDDSPDWQEYTLAEWISGQLTGNQFTCGSHLLKKVLGRCFFFKLLMVSSRLFCLEYKQAEAHSYLWNHFTRRCCKYVRCIP